MSAISFTIAYDNTDSSRCKCQTSKGACKPDLWNSKELSKNKLLWDQATEQSTYSAYSIIQFRENSKCLFHLWTIKGKNSKTHLIKPFISSCIWSRSFLVNAELKFIKLILSMCGMNVLWLWRLYRQCNIHLVVGNC